MEASERTDNRLGPSEARLPLALKLPDKGGFTPRLCRCLVVYVLLNPI